MGAAAHAQPEGAKTEAWKLSQEGHELISQGEFEKAVQKFTYAHNLVPDNRDYQLGLANAWFFVRAYDKAQDLCRPLMVGRKACPEAFQVFGNCQDAQGQSYEALETYRKGLLRFPNAGVLFVEMGIVEAGRDRWDEALGYWEQGIAAQPTLPSNYYFAAKRLHDIGDYAWAAVYAELFINLERTGERVRDMSKLLMASYEKARRYDYEKAFKWQFFQVQAPSGQAALPYPATDSLLDQAFSSQFIDTTATISIRSLIEIRRFVCLLLPTQAPHDPAVGLWEWQQLLGQMDHFEAYHYWLLYDARNEEFMAWFEANGDQYDAFEGWFARNTFHTHIKRPVLRIPIEKKRKR